MKNLILIFLLLGAIGQAHSNDAVCIENHASGIDHELIYDACMSASNEEREEYNACLAESDNNCVNEVFGDIYN